MKPKYITNIEKEGEVFSVMETIELGDSFKDFIGNKISSVYEQTYLDEKMIINWVEIIYKTAQPFYLYLIKVDTGWKMKVYYKPEQFNELKIFLLQLLKQFKNATTNN